MKFENFVSELNMIFDELWLVKMLYHQYKDIIIASCSYDKTIKIWNLTTNQNINTLREYTGEINTIVAFPMYDTLMLASTNDDNSIKIWNYSTNKIIKTLRSHSKYVYSLLYYRSMLISGSGDKTIKIWNPTSDKELIKTLTGHTAAISALVIHNNCIISGSLDTTIKIWDLTSGDILHDLHGHINSVTALISYQDIIISGSSDESVKFWNNEGELYQSFTIGSIFSLTLHNDILIVNILDNYSQIINLNPECIDESNLEHYGADVTTFSIIRGMIISGNKDGTIKVGSDLVIRAHSRSIVSIIELE